MQPIEAGGVRGPLTVHRRTVHCTQRKYWQLSRPSSVTSTGTAFAAFLPQTPRQMAFYVFRFAPARKLLGAKPIITSAIAQKIVPAINVNEAPS